jgi:ion channel POLLUX/CASTOR
MMRLLLAAAQRADPSWHMPRRISNLLKFRLERLVLRGAQYRLLLIAALLGLLSVTAGTLIHLFDRGFAGGFGDAVWWSFLRLSDPGYLGDDHGTLERIVSTALTVLGYVVFLGALVAIMTQWLNERMRELEMGLTPIAQRDHLLIIGWTNRTATIVRELVLSAGRVRRFLELRGARSLRIAILADEVTTALGLELRDRLGSLWNERQVVLRTGSPLRLEHLRRVDFMRAAAVIMPAGDFGPGGPDQADTRAIKTLLSMTNQAQSAANDALPLAVVEILDSRKIDVARRAYGGPVEILASDAIVSRLIAQTVRHRGLSHVYGELLTHGRGNEIYIREAGELEGTRVRELRGRFERAVLLGLVRQENGTFRPLLNPEPDTVVGSTDRLVVMAHGYARTEPVQQDPGDAQRTHDAQHPQGTSDAQSPGDAQGASDAAVTSRGGAAPLAGHASTRPLRLLVLGWNHKVPTLLREFDSYADESFEIDVVSSAPLALREAALRHYDFEAARVVARQIEADYTTPSVLQRLDVARYDNVVLLGSDRLASEEESDARSILGYLLLRDLLPEQGGPAVLIELLDEENNALFRRRRGEVIITPVLLSHMLAQVALRRELRVVFDELFGPGGAEMIFRSPADYGLAGDVNFRDIERAAAARGETALGVRQRSTSAERSAALTLNPERERRFELADGDDVVALTTY